MILGKSDFRGAVVLSAHVACDGETAIVGRPLKEESMPEVVIFAIEGRSQDQKRALMKDITDAVVKNFAVDPAAVVVSLMETPKNNKAKGGVLFSEMKR
jgi:4-oxalocrotonate tautomerase